MSRIYEYQLEPRMVAAITVPKHARVLTVQMRRDVPCMWVLADPNAELIQRQFLIAGTGFDLPPSMWRQWTYHGTFQTGELVLHVFEDGVPQHTV